MKNDKPAVKERYAIKVKGTDTVTYPGKLDYGHQYGIKKLCVELAQFPHKDNDNTAICAATVETEDGKIFSDIGDASPSNVPSGCVQSYIRIASTRAKSRALSDAFNIGALSEEDIVAAENNTRIIDVVPLSVQKETKSLAVGGGDNPISPKQRDFITGLCQQSGKDAESVASERFNKSIDSLVGREANELIKFLQAKSDAPF